MQVVAKHRDEETLVRTVSLAEDGFSLRGVLVHCVEGNSCSTAFVIVYLMYKDRRSRGEVLADV